MGERLIVVGGDAAGMSAASQARRLKDAGQLEIVAFERGAYTSYSACGIPYFVAGILGDDERSLIARTPDEHRERDIDMRMRQEVMAVDTDLRRVTVWDHAEQREYTEGFDSLLIATGAEPVRPPLEGIDVDGIFGVQVLGDGVAIRRWVDEKKPRRAVVIGAGYIGLEMAEALNMRGLHVSVVEFGAQPMLTMDPDMGALVADAIREVGIDLFLEEKAQGFEESGGAVTKVITDKRELEADVVILGIGARPNVKLADDAGIPIGDAKGIVVDRRMQTPVEGVWAAGDCAEKFHLISGKAVAIALGTHANKEGRTAGINLGGGYETFPGVLGTAVTKLCSMEVARTGLNEREADDAGFGFLTAATDSTTRAGYYPDTQPIRTKMIVEKHSGRLLGAQIIGREGAAKRVDVLATALWKEMTVDDMLNMDLSYAPPFSPVWDPVLITARKAWQTVEESR
jgi:NADPH-dependent 2,4-dienoyl-CoA reductase/sulfur reductase-like enzyme